MPLLRRWPASVAVALLALLAALCAAPEPATARSQKLPCDKVRKALAAGATLEQVTAEFNTDAQHVMKCMQSRGHRKARAKPAKKQKSAAPSAHSHPAPSVPASRTTRPPRSVQPPAGLH